MNKATIHNIKLGIFVVTGMLALIIGLYFIGSNRNMFGSTFKLYATFHNVGGLQTGNNVRYAGINVGTVQKIVIINDTTIRVEMSIEASLKSTIKKNSPASLGTDGLMGNKLININPGTPEAATVTEGDELSSIHTVNTEEMLRTLEVTNLNVAVISGNLKDITYNLNKSRGTLYTVMMDTNLAKSFQRTLDNIETASNNLSSIMNDFSTITNDIKQGKGLLGALVKDTVMSAELQQTLIEAKESAQKINLSATELHQSLQKISNGNGTISTLLNDSTTANHFKNSIANIDSSTVRFNENMEAMKHNFLFRGYFKDQEKKKKKEEKKK